MSREEWQEAYRLAGAPTHPEHQTLTAVPSPAAAPDTCYLFYLV
jgi:hypothetical protein